MKHIFTAALLVCFAFSQPSSASDRLCVEAVNVRLSNERAELQTLLAQHHSGQRIDGRKYGLKQNDFDDATNLTLRQRQEFRKLYPNLEYPSSGPLQYPRWAFQLMNHRDLAGAISCSGVAVQSAKRRNISSLLVGSNVNVSKDSISEAETSLAIDPTNPNYLIGASNININGAGQMMYYSSDAGANWASIELVPTKTNHSDPGSYFDSNGNGYAATLDYGGNLTAVKFYKSVDHGHSWPTQIIVDTAAGNDKELGAVDYQTTSGCRDQVYVGWDDGKAQFASSTTAPNSGVFRPKTVLQSKGSTIAAAMAVGSPLSAGMNAPVYYVWTSTTNKTINFSKSTNCGMTWSTYKTIATTVDGYDYGIPAQCVRRALIYPTIDVDRSTSARRGWIYVVWNDFSAVQSSGCVSASDPNHADVWFIRSTDGGDTWSSRVRVNSTATLADHFNQWMAVDDSTGALHVSWRDTRNDPNRKKTDVYYTNSTDGGTTFIPEVKITSMPSDESTSGASPDQYGDYEGLAARNGVVYPFWTDRRVPAPEEIYTDKVIP